MQTNSKSQSLITGSDNSDKNRLKHNRQNHLFNLIDHIPSNNIPWTVILLATGIGIYFALPFEANKYLVILALLTLAALWLVSAKKPQPNTIISSLLIISLGFGAAFYRTLNTQTPLLPNNYKSYDYSINIEQIEPLQNNRIRYSGTVNSLSKIRDNNLPNRLRIRTTDQGPRYKYGDKVCGRAILKRPGGPLYPGGYDFGRALWFKQIGGTGFTISPLRYCQNQSEATALPSTISKIIAHLRDAIAIKIDQTLGEPSRSMARALILGDRGRIGKEDLTALRNAGLGHLLAISGLHMAVFAGTIFFLSRAALALSPTLAQKYPIKKWAAIIALIGGAVYFLISGQSIPTQRAFLMINILFAAILIERPALTLRNVCLAALIILILRPESLLSAGFQMSFAAVTALVVTYQLNLKFQPLDKLAGKAWIKPFYYLFGIWLTSLVATLATAPFAIYHFHQISYMGPIGNMLAIPIFSILLMPSAVVSLALMPLGIEQLALYPLKFSIELLLSTAHWTSSFVPAIFTIGKITLSSVIMITFAALILFFTRRPYIYLSLPLIIIALWTAIPNEMPHMYIGENGDIVALRGADNKLYATKGRKAKFALSNWLRADGNRDSPSDVRHSEYLICDESACTGTRANKRITLLKTLDALEEECQRTDILIYKHNISRNCTGPELILTQNELKKYGTHTIYIKEDKIRVERANDFRRNRIWSNYQ